MFQKYDKDKNGIVNEEEFKEIVKDIPIICKKGNAYVKELLEKVDPLNLNKITFSDVVSLFSSEVIEGSGNNGGSGNGISILDQICLDGQN
jgi:Ca2+-binding EF-hand superfamily protein